MASRLLRGVVTVVDAGPLDRLGDLPLDRGKVKVLDLEVEHLMILVTWSSVRYVSVLMEELEKDHPRD